MSWVNALALAGLAAVALPILIHMMGRAPARVRRFPSLRFLVASRLLPARRTRIQDPLLLFLRALALVVAVLALAGPVLNPAAPASGDAGRAVVAIVDTSASVAGAPNGIANARRIADSVAADATVSTIVSTAHPGRAVAGAGAWLATQRGRRQIVIISDFQLGAFDSADVRGAPPGTELRFRRVPSAPATAVRSVQGGAEIAARATLAGDRTDAGWTRGGSGADARVEVLAGAGEEADAALARQAARVVGTGPASNARAVAIVYPSYSARAALLSASGSLRERWQGDVVARLAADPLIADLREPAPIDSVTSEATGRLLVFVRVAALSEASVAVHAALARALAGPMPGAEAEPGVMTDTALARIRVADDTTAGRSDGGVTPTESASTRWLWLLALILLAAEWLVRRAARPAPLPEAPHVAR